MNGVTVHCTPARQHDAYMYRAVSTVESSLLSLASLVWETEHYSRWFPLLQCSDIAELSRFRKVCNHTRRIPLYAHTARAPTHTQQSTCGYNSMTRTLGHSWGGWTCCQEKRTNKQTEAHISTTGGL